jgi:integrase
MKMKLDHIVPLSNQVSDILKEISRIKTDSQFVFPSPRNKNKCITTNALLTSLRSLGFSKEQFTTHGFRHMASTRLNELGFRDDVIERQLAHTDSNKVRAVYNHAEHLDKRKEMMQQWSDYLDKLITYQSS